MDQFAELLLERLRGEVTLTPAQVAVLKSHCELLLRWNARLNLTTVTELAEVVERHYCESIFLGVHLPQGSWNIADVGSGAGFPGVPVAVIRPECRVTLIESHQRKAVFLRESTRELSNVRVVATRAEDVPESFDWLISRAVSYADLKVALSRIARNAALLTGDVEGGAMPGYEWVEKVVLPWGKQRYLWIGRKPHPR